MKKTLTSRSLLTLTSLVLILSLSFFVNKILPPPMGENEAQAFYSTDTPFPGCLDNYATWNHSTTFNADAEWNLNFMPDRSNGSANYQMETFLDVNGDGLVDYIYADNWHASGPMRGGIQECVYLNTGSGWDPAYRCYATPTYPTDGTHTFYGDCAA